MKKKRLNNKLSLDKKTIFILSRNREEQVLGGAPDRITLVSVFNPCVTDKVCAVSLGCPELTVLTIRNPNCNVPA